MCLLVGLVMLAMTELQKKLILSKLTDRREHKRNKLVIFGANVGARTAKPAKTAKTAKTIWQRVASRVAHHVVMTLSGGS